MKSTNKIKISNTGTKKINRNIKNNKTIKFLGRKYTAIHQARELAVQFLYALEMRPEQNFDEALELFFSPSEEEDMLDKFEEAEKSNPEIKSFCENLVQEVHKNSDEIDQILLHVLTGWRPERVFSVDRAVLKIMILEACIKKTLPMKVAMAEAAKLANNFGTKDSARFVNGVLSKILDSTSQNEA